MRINKWTIWRADLDPVVGSEQGKSRSVLIISEDDINSILNIVNIAPITSRKQGRTIYPNEVLLPPNSNELDKESIALCHQIRTIDRTRLSKIYGQITSKEIQHQIIDAVCFQLGIRRD